MVKEVVVNREVPFAQEKTVIKEVPTFIEKIVAITNETPRIYEVERLFEKVVQVPQIVELPVETPVFVRVNTVVESFRERVVEIPLIHQ